jgi:hypothetical protein
MLDGARIGVDIGRVIMAATDADGTADTSFLRGSAADAMRTPPNEGAFRVLRELAFGANGNVWLVSKAGPRIQGLTRQWLLHWRVFETTGLPEVNVRFCLERRDKAQHARELRLSHFIDDRVDVHEHLRGTVPNLYLFGHQRRGTVIPPWLTHVVTWADVHHLFLQPTPLAACGRERIHDQG